MGRHVAMRGKAIFFPEWPNKKHQKKYLYTSTTKNFEGAVDTRPHEGKFSTFGNHLLQLPKKPESVAATVLRKGKHSKVCF